MLRTGLIVDLACDGMGAKRRVVRAHVIGRDPDTLGVGQPEGRHGRRIRHPSLVVEEVERLIQEQRSAERPAVVVAREVRFRRVRRLKKRRRVQELLPGEEVAGAMNGVAPGSRNRILQPARHTSEFRREVRDRLEFRDRFLTDDQIARAALQVVGYAVDVHLPQPEPAVDGRYRRRAGPGTAIGRSGVDAGLQDVEVLDAAPLKRQRPYGLLGDRVADHRASHFDDRRHGGHFRRFAERRTGHLYLDRQDQPGAEHEVRAIDGRKSLL